MSRRRARFAVLAFSFAIMGLAGAEAAAPAFAAPSVVGLWHFDEGMGSVAADSSGNGNNGAVTGTVNWVPGVSGTALGFVDPAGQPSLDGSVDVPQSSSLEPQQITVQAWVKRLGSPGINHYVVDKGYFGCSAASYGIYSGANGGLQFYVSNNGVTYAQSPDAGQGVWNGNWHLVTGTYDGTTVHLYVDGSEIGSGTPWTNGIGYNLPNSNDLFFGSYFGCPGLDYPGVIDEAQIWNGALGSSQVAANYLTLSPPSATIPYGSSQTYASSEFDPTTNSTVTVTPATTFTLGPAGTGTCSAASCTPTTVGSLTVTGTDGPGMGVATLNVTPTPVTVTANSFTRPFGAPNGTLGATITGLVLGQTLATSGITGTAACTTTATSTSPPGTYPITCTQGTLTATNYTFPPANFVAGTLTVGPAPTSLAAPPVGVVNSILALMPTFTATLTSQGTGTPIAGQRIAFAFSAAPRTTQCSATTNSAGVASCRPGLLSLVTLLLSSSYTASYAGKADYAATATTAPVILLAAGGHASASLRRTKGLAHTLLLRDLNYCSSLKHGGASAARKAAYHGPRCTASRATTRTTKHLKN